MGGRGGSAVGAVVVAPGTSSSVGRVLSNRDVEGRRNQVPGTTVVFSSSKIKPKNHVLLYTEYIRRCSLVLSASSVASAFLLLLLVLLLLLLLASAAAASAAAAAAAATALRTAGWSCSVFSSFSSNSLVKTTW